MIIVLFESPADIFLFDTLEIMKMIWIAWFGIPFETCLLLHILMISFFVKSSKTLFSINTGMSNDN